MADLLNLTPVSPITPEDRWKLAARILGRWGNRGKVR
jgi:hypothetical protein